MDLPVDTPPLLRELRWPRFDWRRAMAVAESEGDERPTWAYSWPAGRRLAEELGELAPCRNRRALDLGCGRGLLGLCALRLGATEVCFADASPQPLRFLSAVLRANGWHQHGRCLLHRWGETLPGAPYQIVLGGDLLYRPECFRELMATLHEALAPNGCALLADPRERLEPELPDLAAAAGLDWEEERRSGYTLARVHRPKFCS